MAALGLGFLVLVHEFGHYVTAKILGIRVEEFSIGFGRYLVKRRWGDTVYGISALPLGGYVRVTGMHREEFEARVKAAEEERSWTGKDMESRMTGQSAISDEEVARTPLERRYYARPVWQRIAFIISGVSMNVVAAFVFMFFVGLQGYSTPTTVVQQVSPGSAAAGAGMATGDKVVSLAGQPAKDWATVQQAIRDNPGATVPVVIERAGKTLQLQATIGRRADGTGLLGVSPQVREVQPGFVESFSFAGTQTARLFTLTFRGIGDMVSGKAPVTGSQGLSGPIGIVTISSEAVRGGFFLSLLAFISVQLAIINMLPLLPLDGGHVLFGIIEKISGRSVSLRTFERVSVVGVSLFLLLAIVATSNDIGRLFSGQTGL